MIKLSNVAFGFQGLRAVDDVSVEINAGECIGLIGPNGAGKTTLLNILAGSLKPQTGSVALLDKTVRAPSPHMFAQFGIARTFQHPRPFAHQTVYENILTAALTNNTMHAAHNIAQKLVEQFELNDVQGHSVTACGLYVLKKIDLARCLALDPKILLIDELMAGLRAEEISFFRSILEEFLSCGRAILFIEHNLNYVREFAKRIIVMNFGRIIADGKPDDVFKNPDVIQSYTGL